MWYYYYIAPEISSNFNIHYDKQVDIYSLGITLYVILSAQLPFNDDENLYQSKLKTIQILKNSFKQDYILWSKIANKHVQHLIIQMCQVNPKKRISIKDIFKHPWILSNYKQDDLFLTNLIDICDIKKCNKDKLMYYQNRLSIKNTNTVS